MGITGDFKNLKEPMQLRNVKKVGCDAGIDLKGIKLKIDRNSELLGKGLFGHTDGSTITLYPDAFTNIETLVKTLGHERIHVYQENMFGLLMSSSAVKLYETAARASEAGWWAFYQLTNGGL